MEKSNIQTIWTIGHSTHPIEEFINILKSFKIEAIVDIRSLPGSRKFPQFNKENLEVILPQNNIEYIHLKNLGGRRKVNKDSKNTAWEHPSFRGFADYMETNDFKEGINELVSIAKNKRVAIMCAEVLWWRCHRSMISDYLKSKGWEVIHIFSADKSDEHHYTKPAKIIDSKLSYSK